MAVRFGVWGDDMDSSSSNYRELRNLVEALESAAANGDLMGTETFLFTDNSTAERAFAKGDSKSPILFKLILRLRRLEFQQGMKLHIIHCAGTRMIAQGTDGISRGDLTEGVMSGQTFLEHIPLHLGAVERSPSVLDWINTWAGVGGLQVLSPTEWYTRGQNIVGGTKNADGIWMPYYSSRAHVWAPPPAAGRIALEQLRRSRHSHSDTHHVFVIPRLMSYEWMRALLRESDALFVVKAGELDCWPKEMHEPLVISLCLPFIRHAPWKLARTPKVVGYERQLREVLHAGKGNTGPILCKLWDLPRRVDRLLPGLVPEVLQIRK